MNYKASTPKGTRDFGPEAMRRRNYIFRIIRQVFALYGFQQIETPAMENMETLMGKYGEEGDRLIFKILNSGPLLDEIAAKQGQVRLNDISEKALRYDLTVPFARYVVQHRNDITFPFKRYQIQQVWRADRPQKGRYREFYQCDADCIGSTSLLNEVELLKMIEDVFSQLNLRICIKLNSRKILAGIAEAAGAEKCFQAITVAIDKWDKIGEEKVLEEMQQAGVPSEALINIQKLLNFSGNTSEKMAFLTTFLSASGQGLKGLEELAYVMNTYATLSNGNAQVELDFTLALGLNNYTGVIIEVKALDVQMGSICGGGRYDDLTGIFGLPDMPGVGISFGIDRIYDVLNELNAFPEQAQDACHVLFTNFGPPETAFCLPLLFNLRTKGIAAEIYPDAAKLKKQLQYAHTKQIPFVALVGEEEMQTNTLTLKNMLSGEQEKIHPDELANKLS